MSIPFRALGRPWSGKNNRFQRPAAAKVAPVVEVTPVVEVAPDAPTVVVTVEEPVVEPTIEPTPEAESDAAGEAMAALIAEVEAPKSDEPEWDPTWTKARLLTVAQGKGLSVTLANTKAEIIAALRAG